MRYAIESKDRIYLKDFGCLYFAKNISKSLSNKCSQNLLDRAEKSTTDAIKTTSRRAIKKTTTEATGDLIGNKIAGSITKVSKTSQNNSKAVKSEEDMSKERYISPEKGQQIINKIKTSNK